MVTQDTLDDTILHAKQWVATMGESMVENDWNGDNDPCCLKKLYTVNTGIGVMQRYDTTTLANNILTPAEIKNVINVINSIINN